MNVKGCNHLQTFKKSNNRNLDIIKWVHAVFVIGSSHQSRRAKICHTYCRTCKKRGPYLHACISVDCVYFGCHRHIREHTSSQNHTFSMDLNYGQLHCSLCNDYVYDSEIDSILMENKMRAKEMKKRLFEWNCTNISAEERDLLRHRTKKICITPQSTIGLRGLINLGNTCFMNCIVQALMHTPMLRDYFLTEKHKCTWVPGTCLVDEVSKLFQEFYCGATVPLVLQQLLHLIWTQARHLAGYEQQDAHEFFIAILDMLHKHCFEVLKSDSGEKVVKRTCIIDQIFTGTLQSEIVCQNCHAVSTTFEPMSGLLLDLGPATIGGRPPSSLVDCLNRFTHAEHLERNYNCSNCAYPETTKQFTMKTLPVVVSFSLKRFEQINKVRKKISTKILFPEMLDLTPFMSRSKKEASPFPSDNRYSLFAVINHIGHSVSSGHYVAFVRQQNDFWYLCDDDKITRTNLKDVLDSEGYLLFYHKHVLEYE